MFPSPTRSWFSRACTPARTAIPSPLTAKHWAWIWTGPMETRVCIPSRTSKRRWSSASKMSSLGIPSPKNPRTIAHLVCFPGCHRTAVLSPRPSMRRSSSGILTTTRSCKSSTRPAESSGSTHVTARSSPSCRARMIPIMSSATRSGRRMASGFIFPGRRLLTPTFLGRCSPSIPTTPTSHKSNSTSTACPSTTAREGWQNRSPELPTMVTATRFPRSRRTGNGWFGHAARTGCC